MNMNGEQVRIQEVENCKKLQEKSVRITGGLPRSQICAFLMNLYSNRIVCY